MAADSEERPTGPTLHSLDKSMAVLQAKLESFVDVMKTRLDTVDATIKESLGTYATKADLKTCDDAINDIRRNITWAVRIVIATVILAVMTAVFKSGLVHV